MFVGELFRVYSIYIIFFGFSMNSDSRIVSEDGEGIWIEFRSLFSNFVLECVKFYLERVNIGKFKEGLRVLKV